MKSVFEKETREELKKRINSLKEDSKAQWGTMNVSQMMKHCSQWDEMALGKIKYKQSFIGKIFGKMALKSMMKTESMKKNLPTVPSFKINEKCDFLKEKNTWLSILEEYGHTK
jgi:hypothetical protein